MRTNQSWKTGLFSCFISLIIKKMRTKVNTILRYPNGYPNLGFDNMNKSGKSNVIIRIIFFYRSTMKLNINLTLYNMAYKFW